MLKHAKKTTRPPLAEDAGKTLIITEKPSVARDITRALGGFQNKKDCFESPRYVVTFAVGHMLELVPPQGVEVERGKWKIANLPVMPDRFDLKPIPKNEPQLKLIKKLYARKDVARVINACDAGREGELIFHYLIRHFNGSKPVQRLWLQSMTPHAIRDGFERLREGEALVPLRRAAVCRSESDWLIGINATRAMTALNSSGGGFSLTTVGRVQTPTLAILVDREKEIQQFDPREYWEVRATFAIASGQYEGNWIDPQAQARAKPGAAHPSAKDPHGTAKPERIWDKSRAEAIVAKCANREGHVSETKKASGQQAPMLFDLTSLQREANRRFGFSAKSTLSIAQALYERHKVLTYPRTDSRTLPEDYPDTARKIMQSLASSGAGPGPGQADDGKNVRPIGHWAEVALRERYINGNNRRIFNDAQVSDHFAIIPTGEVPGRLKDQERRIYELVTRCFIAAFYPAARFENTVRRTVVEDETFETRGRVMIESGWLQVMERKETNETLPPLAKTKDGADNATTVAIGMESKHTKAPPRYNEATLLSAMEGAGKLIEDEALREAMQGRGLGTPATRAAIIEDLIHNRYILRDARELIPTAKATTLLRLLRALKIDELTKAELTGEWEKKLKQIESDQFSSDEFMRHIRRMTRDIVAAARECDVDRIDDEYVTLDVPCPKCGKGNVRETYRKFVCATGGAGATDGTGKTGGTGATDGTGGAGETDGTGATGRTGGTGKTGKTCDFSIWKSIAGREFSPDEVTTLLRDRRLGPLNGFRSRLGREFTADVIIKDDGTTGFDFGDAPADNDVDPQTCDHLGPCPKCRAMVLDTPRRYTCRNALGDKPACDFTIGRQILNRPIVAGEIRQLLTTGKTALLQGFLSKKTKRKFDAHLTLDHTPDSRPFTFEFAPRKTERSRPNKKKIPKMA